MRTIKFRGKQVGNGEWVYGYYFVQNGRGVDGREDHDVHFIYDKGGTQIIDLETVGQFTGLHDKDGTEIYEGDVVKCNQMKFYFGQYTYDVQYNENWCQFGITTGADWHNLSGDKDLYVIGNVHDNAELLK